MNELLAGVSIMDLPLIILSSIAVGISVVTLVVTHLRGPDIKVVTAHSLYPIRGLMYDNSAKLAFFEVNLLVANLGVRPGVLFQLMVDAVNHEITAILQGPATESLPIVIQAGDGWQTILRLALSPAPETWTNFLAAHEYVTLSARWKATASFGRERNETKEIRIDLSPIKASYKSWKVN